MHKTSGQAIRYVFIVIAAFKAMEKPYKFPSNIQSNEFLSNCSSAAKLQKFWLAHRGRARIYAKLLGRDEARKENSPASAGSTSQFVSFPVGSPPHPLVPTAIERLPW